MYSVFLADDERLIREGLAETIDWGSLGLELVGTAEDGRQAVKEIREKKPDIVLTDIRMPFMDGLELIRNIRESRPDCRIVIITAFGEFSYAQSAIQLGVSDFILKPVDIPKLCRTLSQIRKELDETNYHRDEVAEMRVRLQEADEFRLQRLFLRYMKGQTPAQSFEKQLTGEIKSARAAAIVLVQIDNFDRLTGGMGEESIFGLTQQFELSLARTGDSGDETHMLIIEETAGSYILVFTGKYPDELSFQIRSYIRRLRFLEPDLEYTTVTSPVLNGILKCQEGYEAVRRGGNSAFHLGGNRDVQAGDTDDEEYPDAPDIARIMRSIATFNRKKIREDLDRLAEDLRRTGHDSYLYTRMLAGVVYSEVVKLLLDINCSIEDIMDRPTDAYRRILNCTDLDSMLGELYRFIEQICNFLDKNVYANKSVVERAKLFIEGHYSESALTLERVAGEMGITPNYFSTLFKQSTGCSFINYLTKIRISHAKELLKTGNYKTYEVAEKCGYENPTYFSTIFKRQTGFSPSEYK